MAFPILTVLGGAAGIGQSILGSMAKNRAAEAANKQARASYKLDTFRNAAQFELNTLADQTQYAWDRARTAQLRANEATAKADQAEAGARVIENAADNLRLNTEALYDRYITEEALRGDEVALQAAYEQALRADQSAQEQAQYLNRINAAGLEARAGSETLLNQSAELQASLAFDEQKDQMEYWVAAIESTAQDASTKASSFARQGSGNTAQRLAMEGLSELGRKIGEVELRSQDRRAKNRLFSNAMTDKMATLYAQAANQTDDMRSRIAYSAQRFGADSTNANTTMEKLILPTFNLSQRQYSRDLESLQLQTKNTIDNALTPYREQTFFDPMKPIAGLRPSSLGPTMQQKQSLGSMVGSALMGGIKGAMSGTTKNSAGQLKWL